MNAASAFACRWGFPRLTVDGRSAKVDARIRILLRIVDENAGAMHMSSEQMASLLGLSKVRLLRLFNAETGKTYRRYLLEVRMRRAAEMLTDYRIPIKTIASRFDYTAVSNFYRDFKIVHGASPMHMRLMLMDLPLLVPRPPALHSAIGPPTGAPGRDNRGALRLS
jgi:AraC-like DNA-binding protein